MSTTVIAAHSVGRYKGALHVYQDMLLSLIQEETMLNAETVRVEFSNGFQKSIPLKDIEWVDVKYREY